MTDRTILILQVSGFVAALAILPFLHGWSQGLFAAAFTVHFIGDMFRAHKDGVV